MLERALEVVERRQQLLQELLAPARGRVVVLFLGAPLEIFEFGGGAQQAIVELFLFLLELFELLDLLLQRRAGLRFAVARVGRRRLTGTRIFGRVAVLVVVFSHAPAN